ncbi:MAG: YggS family pyridoxal phosphate-dependent enzyme [Schlesneria sp.]
MIVEIRKQLEQNLSSIRERIARACQVSGRSVSEVTLIAVTKYAEIEWVRELIDLDGVWDLGEARPQQLVSRARELPLEICWHLIGHLQRNKAEDILPFAEMIHSVDSVRLFEHLAKLGQKLANPPKILLEVNVSGEQSKDGFDPAELLIAWPKLKTCDSLEIAGLMTMAPLGDSAEFARPVFCRLRELRDRLRAESDGRWQLPELSMGMSGDFEVGIEEGATLIRLGSCLFEGLSNKSL